MPRLFRPLTLVVFLLVSACSEQDGKGRVLTDVPPQLKPGTLITFLLTDDEARKTDQVVAETLAEKGITVVLTSRPKAVPWETHLVGIKEKIRQLWARGVEAKQVSIVGRGGNGLQSLILASLIREGSTRYAVMGACPRLNAPGWEEFSEILKLNGPRMEGQALSLIHTKSPDAGSCQSVFDQASALEGWETDLAGQGKPAIFEEPSPIWIDEVAAWITE